MTTATLTAPVCYDLVESPVGPLFAAVRESGELIALDFGHDFGLLPPNLPPDARRSRTELEATRTQLAEYFAGARREFDLPVELTGVSDFGRSVLEALCDIPYGQTRTYGQLAQAIGKPEAARAVGGALNRNPVAIVVPCHRVIGADGTLTGFGGGLSRKEKLLALER